MLDIVKFACGGDSMSTAWYEYLDKKYVFTGETKDHHGYTLRRIKRTSDGLIGG